MSCHDCINIIHDSGSCHVGCNNPPDIVAKSPNASEEQKKIAQDSIDKIIKAIPDTKVVYRCIWGKSGLFPAHYDPNTVLACTNYNIKGEQKKETNPFIRMADMLRTERFKQ